MLTPVTSRETVEAFAKLHDWEKQRCQFPLRDTYCKNGKRFEISFTINGNVYSGTLTWAGGSAERVTKRDEAIHLLRKY